MDDLSWAEIQQFAKLGVANTLFSVGDTKSNVTVLTKKLECEDIYNASDGYTEESSSSNKMDFFICHKTNTELYFCSKGLVIDWPNAIANRSINGRVYEASYTGLETYLAQNASKIIPEPYAYMKQKSININAFSDIAKYASYNSSVKVFVPSINELSGGFSYFSSNARRILDDSKRYKTRDIGQYFHDASESKYNVMASFIEIGGAVVKNAYSDTYHSYLDTPVLGSMYAKNSLSSPLCFCIG